MTYYSRACFGQLVKTVSNTVVHSNNKDNQLLYSIGSLKQSPSTLSKRRGGGRNYQSCLILPEKKPNDRVRDAFQIKTLELRTLSQGRSTHPPFPLLGTFCIWEIVADQCTHQPSSYLASFMIKLGPLNINPKMYLKAKHMSEFLNS